jgi:predicted enzyme related to lactoylglutathione lyase
MPTRLDCLAIDANDPAALARFWSEALGWRVTDEAPDEVALAPTDEDEPHVPLLLGTVPESKTVQNRVHLDLASNSPEDQAATVARLLDLGASRADVGQGDVPWIVLRDPEGNELCVLEPRDAYATGPVAAIVMHCSEPQALAPFWAAATGWTVVAGDDQHAVLREPGGRGPHLELLRSPGTKTVKNRLHFDVAPYPADDQRAEVARLEALGARRIDIGQGEVSWVVLCDPEGNELCVLTPR